MNHWLKITLQLTGMFLVNGLIGYLVFRFLRIPSSAGRTIAFVLAMVAICLELSAFMTHACPMTAMVMLLFSIPFVLLGQKIGTRMRIRIRGETPPAEPPEPEPENEQQ